MYEHDTINRSMSITSSIAVFSDDINEEFLDDPNEFNYHCPYDRICFERMCSTSRCRATLSQGAKRSISLQARNTTVALDQKRLFRLFW